MPDVLGSKNFIEKLKLKAGYSKNWHHAKRPKIGDIAVNVAEQYEVNTNDIYKGKRGNFNLLRAMVMLKAQNKYCYSLGEIASHFGIASSTVSATVFRLKRRNLVEE